MLCCPVAVGKTILICRLRMDVSGNGPRLRKRATNTKDTSLTSVSSSRGDTNTDDIGDPKKSQYPVDQYSYWLTRVVILRFIAFIYGKIPL